VGFLTEAGAWVNDDNQFNDVCVDELDNHHPTRE
jgi:hypothetical protein